MKLTVQVMHIISGPDLLILCFLFFASSQIIDLFIDLAKMDIEQFMVSIQYFNFIIFNGCIVISKIQVVLEEVSILNNTFLIKINGSCLTIRAPLGARAYP